MKIAYGLIENVFSDIAPSLQVRRLMGIRKKAYSEPSPRITPLDRPGAGELNTGPIHVVDNGITSHFLGLIWIKTLIHRYIRVRQ